jgi:hypothetical protein
MAAIHLIFEVQQIGDDWQLRVHGSGTEIEYIKGFPSKAAASTAGNNVLWPRSQVSTNRAIDAPADSPENHSIDGGFHTAWAQSGHPGRRFQLEPFAVLVSVCPRRPAGAR